MYCSRCGTEVATEARFCNSCGLDVTVVSGKPVPEPDSEVNELDVVREALQEDYNILSELGRGGMAIVYRAHEKQLDREVALKVLPLSLGFDAEFVERFQREARTAAKLEHPNIIPIYRVGKSGRVIYFTMKLLRGKSLAELVEERGPISVEETKRILSETAGALGYAHKHQIVHRDIKPDNILLDDSGHAIVMDFGIAKAATGSRLTGTGMAIGTPHYMSPEQARAQPLDGRSDIYSLGVVTYQCLVGKVPFDAEDAFSIGYKHITEPVPDPGVLTPEQWELFEIIKRMMAKEPADRFQNAGQLLAALEDAAILSRGSLSTRPTTPIGAISAQDLLEATGSRPLSSTTPTTPLPKTGDVLPQPEKKKRGSGVFVAAALLLVLGGGGGGYYYYVNYMAGADVQPVPAAPIDSGALIAAILDSTVVTNDSAAGDTASAATTVDEAEGTQPPTVGMLILTGVPRVGRVAIDGQPVRGLRHELSGGVHRLLIRARGREDFSRNIDVIVGDTLSVAVSMPRTAPPQPAASCSQYDPNRYNRNGECWDVPPRALNAPLVPLTSDIAGIPSPVILLVKVSANGRVLEIGPVRPPEDPNFYILAIEAARGMFYSPAEKNGQPVESYMEMQFSPMPR